MKHRKGVNLFQGLRGRKWEKGGEGIVFVKKRSFGSRLVY